MGCDIHAFAQAKVDGKWADVETKWDQGRHYFLFSWLAGVRNGYGFAGVPTYTPIKPISEPRGLPDDFEREDDEHNGEWIGDHSFSWLTADEIINSPRPVTWRTGIVSREWFDAWDGVTPPEQWSGGITGTRIVVAETPVDVDSDTTHVRIFWKTRGDLDYFVDEIRRLKDEHGDVRLVFGFDN